MNDCRQDNSVLFEVSWEVCNKVGGIYAVLSSKAKTLKERFNGNLIFIGPDLWSDETPSPYFAEVHSLYKSWIGGAVMPEGVTVRVGRWCVPGRPIAVLVKFDAMYSSKDAAYYEAWKSYGVDSLHAYGDYDEACAFGRAAAAVIESIIVEKAIDPQTVVAHFDEWTTGMGLLRLRTRVPAVATVFTTHATSIGRSICGNGKPLYSQLHNYNGDQMAQELNMQSKHSLEKAVAHVADCFTTVSDVTASEAAQLLECRPHVTPNGFERDFVPGGARYKKARIEVRKIMFDVAGALTGNRYADDTFIIATSGRSEYRNKGLDMALDVFDRLRRIPSGGQKILAFVMVPGWCAGARDDLRKALMEGSICRLEDPVLTHRLNNYYEDAVNSRIHQLHFSNDGNANIDVVYVPCYLDGADGLFNKTYYDLLPGLDATVFASYYEPWGYTPLESIAFGVPTITTTLAGFGTWVRGIWRDADFSKCGVRVALRTDDNYRDAVEEIARAIATLVSADARTVCRYRRAAVQASTKASWTNFMTYYDEAYRIAEKNRDSRVK